MPDGQGGTYCVRQYEFCDDRDGMSLRDWFAGTAISPMLVQAYGTTPDILAKKAYEIADALITERTKL